MCEEGFLCLPKVCLQTKTLIAPVKALNATVYFYSVLTPNGYNILFVHPIFYNVIMIMIHTFYVVTL